MIYQTQKTMNTTPGSFLHRCFKVLQILPGLFLFSLLYSNCSQFAPGASFDSMTAEQQQHFMKTLGTSDVNQARALFNSQSHIPFCVPY